MNRSDTRVAIVGAGLAGLVAAWRLAQAGMTDTVRFEARDTPGGRILSIDASGRMVDATVAARDRFDLGPSWFGPALQPALDRLILPPRLADACKDWAGDPLPSTVDDPHATGEHAEAPPCAADAGPWQGRLTGIGSEWSPLFPGYLAGALDAATRGVDRLLATGTH